VAGTHLVAQDWGVAAVGNIYVHPDWRGRGYGALVSSAVTAELLQRGLLVVLNVDQNNPVAINLYRQLGFAVHCPFVEGIGITRNS
jgi:predicted GNAT family acetyltransferase